MTHEGTNDEPADHHGTTEGETARAPNARSPRDEHVEETCSPRALEGNGAGLVREIALATRIQRGLEALYRLDRTADVDAFVTEAGDGQREALLVRETDDGDLELALRVPRLHAPESTSNLDPIAQIIEGVSHFVYLADRASHARTTTQLELEVQAEVDKYVVLAASLRDFDERASQKLRATLYEGVAFVHDVGTEEGERYRLANLCAQRFTARLEREYVARARYRELQGELRRFFRMGQSDKLRAA